MHHFLKEDFFKDMLCAEQTFHHAYQDEYLLYISETAEHLGIDIGMAHMEHAMEYGKGGDKDGAGEIPHRQSRLQ